MPRRALNPLGTFFRCCGPGAARPTDAATLVERETGRRAGLLSRISAITVLLALCMAPTCTQTDPLFGLSIFVCIVGQLTARFLLRRRGVAAGAAASIAVDLLAILSAQNAHLYGVHESGVLFQAFLAVPVVKAGILLGDRATVATGFAALGVGMAGVASYFVRDVPHHTLGAMANTCAPLCGAMLLTAILSVVHSASVAEALAAEARRGREFEEQSAELARTVALQNQAAETAQRRAEEVDQLNALLFQMQQRVESSYAELEEANRRLSRQATTDALTGLRNHRAFQDALQRLCESAGRGDTPLALLMIDVDHFKDYNDTFGHPAGDEVLRSIGALLESASRHGDTAARYGGEEFAMLLPRTDLLEAAAFAEQLRHAVGSQAIGKGVVTVSIGVAVWPTHALEPRSLLCAADAALYNAKRNGRNQVQVSDAAQQDPAAAHGAAIAARITRDFAETAWSELIPPSAPAPDYSRFGGIEGLLQQPAAAMLSDLVAALDVRNQEPCGHSLRIARYSVHLLKRILAGADASAIASDSTHGDLRALAMGALLHDLGKLYVPQYMLRSDVHLSAEEHQVLRRHPVIGAELVSAFASLQAAQDAVRYHHERWDGEGYPDRLRGADIPLVARVLSLCSAFEKMTSSRVPTPTSTHGAACEEIRRNSGTRFDPQIVDAFLAIPADEWIELGLPAPPVYRAA